MSGGQKQSITSVIKAYSQRLLGFIRGRVSTREDAEDILQDVWVSLNNVVDLEAIENIGAWLFRNARNRITDRYRKKKEQSLGDPEEMEELMISPEELPHDEFFQEVFWQELMLALEKLPEKQRDVIYSERIRRADLAGNCR